MKEPKPKRETKQASIAIRTTKTIKDAAEDAALSENRSLSQWVESLIISAIKKVRARDERRAAEADTKDTT